MRRCGRIGPCISDIPQPIYDVAAIRDIEARHASEDPPLMERAGAAATRAVLAHSRGTRLAPLIACGPGNNGGDGFVVARLLRSRGINPTVVYLGEETKLPADALEALAHYRRFGGEIDHEIPKRPFSLVVDALFGIGLQRPIEGAYAELIDRINGLGCPVLALDVPSGLCADTGRVLGRAVKANYTATFIALKPGLLTLDTAWSIATRPLLRVEVQKDDRSSLAREADDGMIENTFRLRILNASHAARELDVSLPEGNSLQLAGETSIAIPAGESAR